MIIDYLYISVDKYFSPPSGNRTTIFLSFSFIAISTAALTAAPDDMPISNPSFFATVFPIERAFSFETVTISSQTLKSKFLGIKFAPMP